MVVCCLLSVVYSLLSIICSLLSIVCWLYFINVITRITQSFPRDTCDTWRQVNVPHGKQFNLFNQLTFLVSSVSRVFARIFIINVITRITQIFEVNGQLTTVNGPIRMVFCCLLSIVCCLYFINVITRITLSFPRDTWDTWRQVSIERWIHRCIPFSRINLRQIAEKYSAKFPNIGFCWLPLQV